MHVFFVCVCVCACVRACVCLLCGWVGGGGGGGRGLVRGRVYVGALEQSDIDLYRSAVFYHNTDSKRVKSLKGLNRIP